MYQSESRTSRDELRRPRKKRSPMRSARAFEASAIRQESEALATQSKAELAGTKIRGWAKLRVQEVLDPPTPNWSESPHVDQDRALPKGLERV
jgi:hypothetical protein